MTMNARLARPALVLVALCALLLAACGADDADPVAEEPVDTVDDTVDDPDEADEADEADEVDEGDTPEAAPEDAPAFTVAFPSVPGFSHVALHAAIRELRERGYDIDSPYIAESELAVEGTARGEFQFGSGPIQAAMVAVEQGAPIQMLSSRIANEWVLYSTLELSECSDLDGQRLAIHSEGAVGTAILESWIDDTCPEISPDWLVIAGSANRLQALLAGQIDATPLELGDTIDLEHNHPGEYNLLANFSEELPWLKTTMFYGNADFIESHPDIVQELITEQIRQHRLVSEDPEYLRELALEFVPDIDQETLDAVAETYSEFNMFPPDGGLDRDDVERSIQFYVDAGHTDGTLTIDDLADTSFVEAANAALDG